MRIISLIYLVASLFVWGFNKLPLQPSLAYLFAALMSLVVVSVQFLRNENKTLDILNLSYFTIMFILINQGATIPAADFSLYLILTLNCIVSLAARQPFTYQYFRSFYPKALWKNRAFIRTNDLLTGIWGLCFAASGYQLAFHSTNSPTSLLLANSPNLVGVLASIILPQTLPALLMQTTYRLPKDLQWAPPDMNPASRCLDFDVIVIGSGIGGLTCAAKLSQQGLRIAVVEQHYLVGGACTTFQRGRAKFDAGVEAISGLGPQGPVRTLLRDLGIEHRLDWKRVPTKYVMDDITIDVPDNYWEFLSGLCQNFPHESESLKTFFDMMLAAYQEMQAGYVGGVPYIPQKRKEFLDYPKKHPNFAAMMDATWGAVLDEYFHDRRLKAILSTLTSYIGDSNENTPAAGMVAIFGYYIDGGYYPKGGSQVLADALADVIRTHGGKIIIRRTVERIMIENGKVTGIEMSNGERLTASVIVSNADPKQTYEKLVGMDKLPKSYHDKVRSLRPSTSALMAFITLRGQSPVQSRVFLRGQFQLHSDIHVNGVGYGSASHLDPTLAPPGGAVITMISLTPTREEYFSMNQSSYQSHKEAIADMFLTVLETQHPGIREDVISVEIATPRTFHHYLHTTGGSIYNIRRKDFVDQGWPHHKAPIQGLYLVGAGTFPGPGVEAVVISGNIVCQEILSHTLSKGMESQVVNG